MAGDGIERGRLSARLHTTDTPLILLHAPAGYGKSVLLAQWELLDSRPFVSIVLNESHDDPAVFLAAVIDAARPLEPLELPAEEIASAKPDGRLDLDLVVPRLEAALRRRRVDSVLVLDELDHLRSAESLRLLEAIMNGTVGDSRLAMASRAVPPVHVARLQAEQRLIVLDTRDLSMTRGEASRLLSEAGLRASEGELARILSKTEGWPVALCLATLGKEHGLVDYVREEFLASASAADVEFLVHVSLLDRLGGDLCDAVTGCTGCGARLSSLARQNILLNPLDGRDEWFRMHPLFAEMLRLELRLRHGEQVAELNRRASTWWERAGDPEQAIRFAIDGDDFARAGRLIWEAMPTFSSTGHYGLVQGWVERVGLARATVDPHLSLTLAHGALAAGDGGAAEYWAGIARPLLAGTAETSPDLPAALAIVEATLARGGTAEMAAAAESARASLNDDSPWGSIADLMAGLAAHLAGDAERARYRLMNAARGAAVWGVPLVQVFALAQLALLSAAEGDWPAARILASQARAQVDRSGLIGRPSVALAVAVFAYVNANDRRREEAVGDLRTARALLARLDDFGAWFEVETRAALAAAACVLNDPELADDLLGAARRRLLDLPDAPMLEVWLARIEAGLEALAEDGFGELTPAEMKVVRLLPSHLSYPQIAFELTVSPNTIKTQVRSAFGKLGVSSRHEAVELIRLSPHQGDSARQGHG